MYLIVDQNKGSYFLSNKLKKAIGDKFMFITHSPKENRFFIGTMRTQWMSGIMGLKPCFNKNKKMWELRIAVPHPSYLFAHFGISNQIKKINVKPVLIADKTYYEICFS